MAREVVTQTGSEGTRLAPAPQDKIRAAMQIIVSFFLLIAGIFIITAPNHLMPHTFDEATKRAAIGWIGLVVGYWLS